MKKKLIKFLKYLLSKLQPKEVSLNDFYEGILEIGKSEKSEMIQVRVEQSWMSHRPKEKKIVFSAYVAGYAGWTNFYHKTPQDAIEEINKKLETCKLTKQENQVDEVTY